MLISGILILAVLLLTAIVSFVENEKYAVKKTLFLTLCFLTYLIIPVLDFPYQNLLEIILMSFFAFFGILMILPIQNTSKIKNYIFSAKIDERDIMFSRKDLNQGTKNYNEYYNSRPEKKDIDDKIRQKPGILAENTSYFNRILFASAKATFSTVECFNPFLNAEISADKFEVDPTIITNYIKSWAKQLGAKDCGVTLLLDYHKYSHRGRTQHYGEEVNLNHKYAIAFTVEMSNSMIAPAPAAPTVMESAQQYLNAGTIAMQIAFFINELGHDALAHIDGNYQVVCPLVAKDAGLGEIGRMGLLITPELGPRVRIAVVTTNLPMITDTPTFEPSVIDFCNICKKCADTCPGKAISNKPQENIDGQIRWQINQEACYNYWVTCGTDCARCMSVCPYSHPNNLLHNTVRRGLKNSYLFRRFAIKADNFLYGRKPAPKKSEKWIEEVRQ